MLHYMPLPETVRYENPRWPGFYVLIVPNKDDTERSVYLCHERHAIVHYMWGCCEQSDGTMEPMEKTVECAHWTMEDYLPDFIKACCTEENENE